MSDNIFHEEPQETADWQRGMLRMACHPITMVVFGESLVCAKTLIVDADKSPALALYRLTSPDGEKPWGIENVECCKTLLVFRTRRSLDAMRSWLAMLDREFDGREVKTAPEVNHE